MAKSDPRAVFGVHGFTAYSRTDGTFYGSVDVLGGSSLALSGELIKLNGGSFKFPVAVEDGLISAEMTIKPKEYPDFLFELFLGKAPTAAGADADGSVDGFANKLGTSVFEATTGIATVAAIPTSGPADLKFTKYVVKAVSATTVDVYAASSVDFSHGVDVVYENDALKITASPLTITSGGDTDLTDYGLRFTGGSGTIALTTGDTAVFEVLPPSSKSMSVVIGSNTDVFPEFGAIVVAKKRGNGEMFEIDVFRCKGVGLPLNMEENAFSEAEVKCEAFYDAAKGGIMKIRDVVPS